MAKKTASKKARAKQATPKKKAKKKKPTRPAKPAQPRRGKKAAAKTSTAAHSARKPTQNSAAVSPSPSVAVARTSPSVETQRPAPVDQRFQQPNAVTPQAGRLPTPAGAKAENMREGLAFIDQQRVINNLDRERWGAAPTPTGHAHEPANARLVAHHAARLEDELDRGAAAIAAMDSDNRQRELLWGLGLARKPRAAIVGRALFELHATSWENASQGKNDRIANHIRIRGPHHLSKTITEVLRTYDSKASTAAGATLAPHLRRALELLQHYDWLKARTQGVYLDGDGLTLFVDFPDWSRRDEEPGKLRRIRGHRKPS
jgi:hypothetical protein